MESTLLNKKTMIGKRAAEHGVVVASFPGSPKARAEEKKRRAWYQPSTHAQVLPRFWVNRILSVHPPSPKRHHS